MKVKTILQLKKVADKVVSEYIRKRDKGRCFTCGITKDWKEMQCGHFVSRVYNSLRWFEKNLNCQCYSCNIMKYGNMDEYAARLELKYGEGIIQELNRYKHMPPTPLKHTDLLYIIETYKNKIKAL